MVSCGDYFTVCVDHEGFIWSFGQNNAGQLGTGNKTNFNVPQKLQDIPPVLSVSCGSGYTRSGYTLIITTDSNLWTCGRNDFGQLCQGNRENRLIPQKTSSFVMIICGHVETIQAENYVMETRLIAQNLKKHHFQPSQKYQLVGIIHYFKIAKEKYLHVVIISTENVGHFNSPQITPILIPNAPSNIVQFASGSTHSLFLDCEGNVFSVGYNYFGQLGRNTKQNELNKIPNIPPIKIISCTESSSYLIDFEGNLWTFGLNDFGQLGHGDKRNKNAPKMINTLKDIQQISYGSCGRHFIAKNSQNQIFVTGFNDSGQLGTGDTQSLSIPKEIDSQYSTIWRDEFYSRAKSARK